MNPVEKVRWYQFTPNRVRVAVVLVVLGFVIVQHRKTARLEADVHRLQSSNTALLNERVDWKWRAEAWEKEAVQWREKMAAPQLSSAPPPSGDTQTPVASPAIVNLLPLIPAQPKSPTQAPLKPFVNLLPLIPGEAASPAKAPPNWGSRWFNGQWFYIVPLASPQ